MQSDMRGTLYPHTMFHHLMCAGSCTYLKHTVDHQTEDDASCIHCNLHPSISDGI